MLDKLAQSKALTERPRSCCEAAACCSSEEVGCRGENKIHCVHCVNVTNKLPLPYFGASVPLGQDPGLNEQSQSKVTFKSQACSETLSCVGTCWNLLELVLCCFLPKTDDLFGLKRHIYFESLCVHTASLQRRPTHTLSLGFVYAHTSQPHARCSALWGSVITTTTTTK